MLLDILSSNNYISVNKKLVQIFGINTAVYLGVVLSIYSKATRKKGKLKDDKYLVLERGYVRNETTLSKEEQLACDAALKSVGVLSYYDESDVKTYNIFYIDIDKLTCLITDMTDDDIKKIKEDIKCGVNLYKEEKREKRKSTTISNYYDFLYSKIVYDERREPEMFEAVKKWIGIIGNRFGFQSVTPELLNDFETKINNYAKGDVNVALGVINIASIFQYKDASWAINAHKKESKKVEEQPRCTHQERATRLGNLKF